MPHSRLRAGAQRSESVQESDRSGSGRCRLGAGAPSGTLKLIRKVFGPAMCNKKEATHIMLGQALTHLQRALELLDGAGAPGHLGANVDLAMNQLLDELGGPSGAARSMFSPGDESCGTARPS